MFYPHNITGISGTSWTFKEPTSTNIHKQKLIIVNESNLTSHTSKSVFSFSNSTWITCCTTFSSFSVRPVTPVVPGAGKPVTPDSGSMPRGRSKLSLSHTLEETPRVYLQLSFTGILNEPTGRLAVGNVLQFFGSDVSTRFQVSKSEENIGLPLFVFTCDKD